MNDNEKWPQLASQARKAPAAPLPELPFGFSTRVVARWQASAKTAMPTLWEWFSVRSLLVACAVMAVAVGLNYDLLAEGMSSLVPVSPETFELIYNP
jgi:anti-sigma-K factor RskA